MDSSWAAPLNIENNILDLIGKRDPLLLTRAYPDLIQIWDHYEYDRLYEANMVAIRTINTLQESIKLLLQRIRKFTSPTFHVLLREIVPDGRLYRTLKQENLISHDVCGAQESVFNKCQGDPI